MDLSTVFGLILGITALLIGIFLKGVALSSLLNLAAILIIVFGTIATVVIAFPMNELKRVPKLFGIIFKEQKLASDAAIIRMFSGWADVARREGLLSLEAKTEEIVDPFLKNGLALRLMDKMLIIFVMY